MSVLIAAAADLVIVVRRRFREYTEQIQEKRTQDCREQKHPQHIMLLHPAYSPQQKQRTDNNYEKISHI
jgi:hypothetical protein